MFKPLNPMPNYLFYATLLDAYQDYASSNELYQEFWGFSEDPSKTEEEFEKEQYQKLLNRINRVPIPWEETEKMDRGTAFNEVIDCLIQKKTSEKMVIRSDKEAGIIYAEYNKRTFVFPLSVCLEFSRYFTGAICQVYTSCIIDTKYGEVMLYGYIDELMPTAVHDIKVTEKYKAGKFRNHWQKIVYPLCLQMEGNYCDEFEYNVLQISKTGLCQTFTEYYHFIPSIHVPKLRIHVESLIEFLEANRDKITDQKIFNLQPADA